MIYDKEIIGKKVKLRMLELSDCNETYLSWMNDAEVNQFLESKWSTHSIDSLKDFVRSTRESSNNYIFAIVYDDKHIGNIKLGPIHPMYLHAYIGYMIGEKSLWGKGIATDVIMTIMKFAFEELKLHKLQAGAFEPNIGSRKVLQKCGFSEEAIFRKKAFFSSDKEYCDIYEYGILASEYKENKMENKK